MTQKRVILRAELAPQAKTGLEKICEARGMTQLSVMSRLILWFSAQDGRLQHAVLGNTDDDASKMVLEDLVRRIEQASKK